MTRVAAPRREPRAVLRPIGERRARRRIEPGRSERDLRAIEIDVVARTDFGHAVLLDAESDGRRGADTDFVHFDPERPHLCGEVVERPHFGDRHVPKILDRRRAVGVAGVAEESAKMQFRELGDASDELRRIAASGVDSAAMEADIHFHQNVHFA